MYQITALVPMKGRSERVQGKNLRPFAGKPLCTYILDTLEQSQYINRVIVNTDSDEIARVCQEFSKVTIHNRIREIQGHHIPMNSILHWDIENNENPVEHYLQTHVTNPLLRKETIDNAIKHYFDTLEKFDSLFSVTLFQSRLYDAMGNGINHDPKKLINTQYLPKLYEENSNIYIFSKTSFRNAGHNRLGLKPTMFETNKMESLDIDTNDDFVMAESAYHALKKEKF